LNTKSLILCASTKLDIPAGEALPTRLKLLNWGSNPGTKGDMICNATTLRELGRNQRAANYERIAFDFEHNSVKNSDAYRGEPAAVAGYGIPEVVEGEGLFLNSIEWTAEGKQFIGGRHYVDQSPALLTNARGEVIFIHSAAACRNGALNESRITLNSSDLPALNSMTDYKPLILMILGLPETATDADIEAAAKAFAEKNATLNTAAETLGKLDLTKLTTLAADFKALTDKFTALEAKVSGDEYQAVLNSAAAEGKVIPKALTEGAGRISLEQLKLLTANTPVTVPLEKRTPAHVPVEKITLNSADEENVRKQLGIPKEVWDAAK
jgi:phage I-like protein